MKSLSLERAATFSGIPTLKKLVLASSALLALSVYGCKKEEPPAPAKPVSNPVAAPVELPAKRTDAAGGDIPAECQEYKEKMTRCLQAPEFPPAAKPGALKELQNGWGNMGSMTPEAKAQAMAAAADACKQALAGMKTIGDTMCKGVW
jgi:hypothetical protein